VERRCTATFRLRI